MGPSLNTPTWQLEEDHVLGLTQHSSPHLLCLCTQYSARGCLSQKDAPVCAGDQCSRSRRPCEGQLTFLWGTTWGMCCRISCALLRSLSSSWKSTPGLRSLQETDGCGYELRKAFSSAGVRVSSVAAAHACDSQEHSHACSSLRRCASVATSAAPSRGSGGAEAVCMSL